MKVRTQFGIRALMLLILVAALALVVWQSIPKHGNPILDGQIVDIQGNPVPGVEIILHSGVATRFPNQRTTTDQAGRFRFSPLTTGSFVFSDSGDDPMLFVGIRVLHPQYEAVDGAQWWDISVPWIKHRRHRWNLVMRPVTTQSAD